MHMFSHHIYFNVVLMLSQQFKIYKVREDHSNFYFNLVTPAFYPFKNSSCFSILNEC